MNFATVCVSFWPELFPSLTSMLLFLLKENEESKVIADEATKKSEHLKRENDRLRNLSADLSQQVCGNQKLSM